MQCQYLSHPHQARCRAVSIAAPKCRLLCDSNRLMSWVLFYYGVGARSCGSLGGGVYCVLWSDEHKGPRLYMNWGVTGANPKRPRPRARAGDGDGGAVLQLQRGAAVSPPPHLEQKNERERGGARSASASPPPPSSPRRFAADPPPNSQRRPGTCGAVR